MKKIIIIILIFVLGGLTGYFSFKAQEFDFGEASPKDAHTKIIATIYAGIEKAQADGDYQCCIHPACTMCYLEGNKWNYGKAGTCACDDFIARGEEACPQCKRGLSDIHDETNSSCDADALVPTCDSIKDSD